MVVSHKYKFIFIKTKKTAGTSIEVELNKVLGERDIATPILPKVKGHVAQNFKFKMNGNEHRFRSHAPASRVIEFIGQDLFDDYFVFCVEREPVDKCISHFSMVKNSPTHNSGNENLLSLIHI